MEAPCGGEIKRASRNENIEYNWRIVARVQIYIHERVTELSTDYELKKV